MDNQKWVIDTNFVYDLLPYTFGKYDMVITPTVREELDNHKTAHSEELKFKARMANRFIFENFDAFTHSVKEYDVLEVLGTKNNSPDNRIVASAKAEGYGILTNDLNMYVTAKTHGIEVRVLNEKEYDVENYKGFIEVYSNNEELQNFKMNFLKHNRYNLLINQYLVFYLEDDECEVAKWTGEEHVFVSKTLRFRSNELGEFKARDAYQLMAIDSIITNQATILRGSAGTAKTLSALSYAMQEIGTARNFDKLIIVSNSLPTKDAFYHGLVKGTLLEKLLDSTIGNILSSKLGDRMRLEYLIQSGRIEIIPMSDIRGWESPPKSLIVVTEAQNLSVELMKLLIQRMSQDSKIIIEGDNLAQLDSVAFTGMNNGMRRASEILRNTKYYGEVELQNIYRSPLAELVDRM